MSVLTSGNCLFSSESVAPQWVRNDGFDSDGNNFSCDGDAVSYSGNVGSCDIDAIQMSVVQSHREMTLY